MSFTKAHYNPFLQSHTHSPPAIEEEASYSFTTDDSPAPVPTHTTTAIVKQVDGRPSFDLHQHSVQEQHIVRSGAMNDVTFNPPLRPPKNQWTLIGYIFPNNGNGRDDFLQFYEYYSDNLLYYYVAVDPVKNLVFQQCPDMEFTRPLRDGSHLHAPRGKEPLGQFTLVRYRSITLN